MKPYAIFAFEFDTDVATGQADGGSEAGKYLEFGIAPGYTGYSRAAIAFPIKLGMSMGDYYELATARTTSLDISASEVSSPCRSAAPTSSAAWNLHFGAEYQKLGDTTAAFNADDEGDPQHNQFIGSVGLRILLLSRPGGVDGRIGPGAAAGRRSLRGRAVSWSGRAARADRRRPEPRRDDSHRHRWMPRTPICFEAFRKTTPG